MNERHLSFYYSSRFSQTYQWLLPQKTRDPILRCFVIKKSGFCLMKSRRSHEEIIKNFTCNRTRCVHYARAGARASTGLPLITFFFVFHSFDVDSFVVAVPPIKMSNCKFMLGAEWIKFLMELLQLIDVYLCPDGRFIGCIRFQGLDVTMFRYRDIGGSVGIKISDIRCCG